jgi:hypothetical protein
LEKIETVWRGSNTFLMRDKIEKVVESNMPKVMAENISTTDRIQAYSHWKNITY